MHQDRLPPAIQQKSGRRPAPKPTQTINNLPQMWAALSRDEATFDSILAGFESDYKSNYNSGGFTAIGGDTNDTLQHVLTDYNHAAMNCSVSTQKQ